MSELFAFSMIYYDLDGHKLFNYLFQFDFNYAISTLCAVVSELATAALILSTAAGTLTKTLISGCTNITVRIIFMPSAKFNTDLCISHIIPF